MMHLSRLRLLPAAWFAAMTFLAEPLKVSAVTFEFAAPAIFSTHPTFDLPAPTGSVVGRFTYDPASVADYEIPSDDDEVCECLGYWQHRAGGFTATFGNMTVSADDYVIELYNDLPQGGDRIADVVTIIYSSDLEPPPATPLLVNGVPHYSGHLMVSFLQYGGQQFEIPALGELQGLENFGLAMAFLGDEPLHAKLPTDVSVILESLIVPAVATADFNQDAHVDGSDFLIWQRNVGQSDVGDASGDGLVDAADLNVWQSQYLAATSSTTVAPEPGALVMASLALLLSKSMLRK